MHPAPEPRLRRGRISPNKEISVAPSNREIVLLLGFHGDSLRSGFAGRRREVVGCGPTCDSFRASHGPGTRRCSHHRGVPLPRTLPLCGGCVKENIQMYVDVGICYLLGCWHGDTDVRRC